MMNDKQFTKLVLLVLVVFMMPMLVVGATPPSAEPGISFVIHSTACTDESFTGGNFDLLVKREDVEGKITSATNNIYTTMYGDIPDIAYLQEDDSIWLSYLSNVENANVANENACFISFAQGEDEYFMFNEVKLVYFSDTGETIYISEAIEILHPKAHEARFGEIHFYAYEPYSIDNQYTISGGIRWIFVLILGIQIIRWIFYPLLIIAGIIIMYAFIRCIVFQVKRR